MGACSGLQINQIELADCLIVMFILSFYGQVLHANDSIELENGSFDRFQSNGIASEWADNSGWADVRVKYSAETSEAHSKQFSKD